MPSKLDSALTLARKGFRVFPLPVDDPAIPPKELKKPHLHNWPMLATTDHKKIRRWWSESDYNIGLATGQGLVVLDYDMKDGQLGQKALATHDMLGLPLDGMSATTATGGRHFLFRTDKTIPNSASKVAKNVDVRGDGGYIVAPGSTIHGVPYVSENLAGMGDLPELPEWIAKLALANRTRSSVKSQNSLVTLDQPSQIDAATNWLRDEAPEAIEGSGGDQITYKTACRVRDFGVTKASCLELLLDWNENKAAPPWSYEELETKVANAYHYATLPAGIADAKGELGDVSELLGDDVDNTDVAKAPKRKLFYVDFGQAADQALDVLSEPLIEDVINCGGLSVMYGRPEQGKTFGALSQGFHIAAGLPWNGHNVKQGLVIYIAAEGGYMIYKRLRALKMHHGIKDRIPFAIVPCSINLLDPKQSDAKELLKLIRQAEEDYGQKATLVVIDTLSRAIAGADENSSTDMGAFIKTVDRLRAAAEAHFMIVAHAGKDQSKGVRGWSGILAAVDTEMEVHEGRLAFTKQRDMEKLDPIRFTLKVIEIGQDAKGRRVTSCVLDMSAEAVARAEMAQITPQQREVLEVFKEYFSDPNTTKPVKTRQFIDWAFTKRGRNGLTSSFHDRNNLRKVAVALSEIGYLNKTEDGQWLMGIEVDEVD